MTEEKVVLVYDWHSKKLLDSGLEISEEEYKKHKSPKKTGPYSNTYYKTFSDEYKCVSSVEARAVPLIKQKALEKLLRETKFLRIDLNKHFRTISHLL